MKPDRVMGTAALLVAIGICIGALASHALREVLTGRQLEALGTAVDYQIANALGLFMIGLLMRSRANRALPFIAMGLIVGILCFSGGIYLMLAGAPPVLGFVTPIGGVLLILAWLSLAVSLYRSR